jgi:ubiquinone/menaquinone biosynthesis C-methylase UbiE
MANIKSIIRQGFRIWVSFASLFDKYFLVKDVPLAQSVSHSKWRNYLYANFNKPGVRVLEVGSREVTGASFARSNFSNATYIGFDYYDGDNVDVVGDAHKLSSYFAGQEKFDLIYSSACFEHFAMPWVVATEIAKLLKVGGTVFVETHFSFSSHERPWHFFHYTDMALRTLFPPANGFECIEVGFSNPLVGRFSSLADGYLKNQPVAGMYCHIDFLGKKVKDVDNFDWNTVDLEDVVGDTKYPEPKE